MLSKKEVHTMQTIKKDLNWRDNEALSRYTLIAPLLDESLDPAKRSQLREEAGKRLSSSDRLWAR